MQVKQMDNEEIISITLPSEMISLIKEKVQTGLFDSPSELIREAMRVWQKQEDEYQAQLSLFRERLERSANSGKPVPIDQVFGYIEKLHQQRIACNDSF